ncbi:uncharacterized protein LOC107647530 [Arachis ipaensis]|uniref:uncharacterized protein LOC107647530 n=1 Tax=Arachis ipaensis TaxID=130454 RepID=UPI0007AF4892|nr:uncharacterized protein LOC107647530 [Arachis ipaensis]
MADNENPQSTQAELLAQITELQAEVWRLAIDKAIRPVAQKKRNLGEEKKQAALEETKKLLNAGFIREIRFTTWLSNVVMVRKNSVDNASGFKSLSFMDAYSGYNQILMHPEDQSKTAFITEHGNFCYKAMPFGLKNAWATYQRLMDKVFRQQIGRNMEIYVDDMVAKTSAQGSHCDDLLEVFNQVRAYNMRLNPDKCAFGVQGEKFLGFMLTSRGIEANPEKLSNHAISSSLVIETGKKQNPVYFISRVLQPTETRYPKIEQLALALITTARRLRHYFQSYTIIVRTDQPLRQILTRLELAGRLIKWSVELSEFDIQYESRKTLKSQVLADFVSEMTNETQPTEASWSIHVDGASNREGSGAGILLKEGDKVIAEQSLQFRFNASNNQAEYEALLAGLKLAQQLKIPRITIYCDSSLVVHQIKGEYQVQDWRTPFLDYINTGAIPNEEPNLPLFRRRASFYIVVGNTLYRRGHSQPLLKCISKDEAEEVMAETHEGVCGNHVGGRALAAKILRTEYYWSTIKETYLKSQGSDNCQKHATVSGIPAEKLHTIEGSKKKLSEAKGEWADLIPEILWSYNTTIQSATGETPFKMVYGAEALIPLEVSIPTIRTEFYNQQNNLQARTTELDLVEEERDILTIRQRAMKMFIE